MVEIHDLHVRFHGASREAVAGIDLTIRDGEVVGLVGESGSGKTVTAMTLSGLIERKKVTLSGEVRFDGRDILRLPRAELRAIQGRELGVVFQEPMTAMDPAHAHRSAGRGGACRPHAAHKGAAPRACARGAARCGPPRAGGNLPQVPARVLRRSAPARDDRRGHRHRSAFAAARRADHRARRDRTGADPRSAPPARTGSAASRCCSSRTICRSCVASARASP